MNKQELLKTLEEWKKYRNSQNHEFQYYQLAEVINLVEQLDEPQKVKVPAYVADLLDYYKESTDVELVDLLVSFNSWHASTTKNEEHGKAIDWLVKNPELYMRAWLDGYEVEEEPKYRLVLPHISKMVHGHATKIHNMKTKETKDLAYDTFTEQEIKSIDERYWPFAVPVEEVEE